ncbi:MAG: DMT family transporter [Paludibacteraceae bacterium]|nr:DMT family transporter [Paludibacteraceae bacterium]
MKNILPYIAVVTSMLIWSVSGIAIKFALEVFPPHTMIVVRFSLSVLLMLVIGLACKGNPLLGLKKIERQDIPVFLLCGLSEPCLYYITETYAYKALSSPTIAEALLSTSPLLAPLFAFVFLRERVTLWNIAGIVVSTAGMLMLVFVGASDFSIGSMWGLPLAFAAVSMAVTYTILLKRIPEKYNPFTTVFYTQVVALLFFWPLWGFTDGMHAGGLLPADVPADVWWRACGSIVYLAAFSSVAAFVMFCYTIRRIGVTRTNAFNNIRPAFTALFMYLFLAEQLPAGKLAGIALIIAGLFISQKK